MAGGTSPYLRFLPPVFSHMHGPCASTLRGAVLGFCALAALNLAVARDAQAESKQMGRTGASSSPSANKTTKAPTTIGPSSLDNPTADAPPTLESLQGLRYDTSVALYDDENQQFEKLEIRLQALREAALSLGARAGLSSRTWEIRQTLKTREAYMDRVFDFRQLLIKAPSGLLIEPPVVYESFDALNIEDEGQTAAVADRILNINKSAKIVTAPRNWRSYLERDWGKVQYPPAILYPKDESERIEWNRLVQKGWEEGRIQADEIFQSDLNRLTADFNGMVRYRMLLTQGMITPPFALEVDRGITGGGSEMRVGDRAVQITGPSQLQPDSQEWKPADR